MEFGFSVMTSRTGATVSDLVHQVKLGEQLGFDMVAVSDHVVIPISINSTYPYSAGGAFTGSSSGDCLEQLTEAMFLAAHTTRIKVLTSVMVLPHRPPVLAAKALATIDVLSNGRLIVGVGAGWMREEFEALGAPPFDKRGAVAAEYIQLFKELWTAKTPSFSGPYASISGVHFEPKPVQKPYPPIWVGGESPSALRRAGRLGDAWYPIGSNPTYPMDTLATLKAGIEAVRNHSREAGRTSVVATAYNAGWYDDRKAATATDGSRRFLTGEPSQVAEDLHALEQLGVRHVVLGFGAPSPLEIEKRMERFANTVRPLTRR